MSVSDKMIVQEKPLLDDNDYSKSVETIGCWVKRRAELSSDE